MEKLLSPLHQELLRLKQGIMQQELQRTVVAVATEMGIDAQKENWHLSPDYSRFIKVEEPTKLPDQTVTNT